MNKILIISGATASGKSGLATRIADRTKPAKEAVIINADSMQIYSELSILSAQPNAEDLKQHPHFLYSVLKHNQNSSLAIWLEMAKKAIDQALESEQLPIVVGGTGLYLSKLIDGISHIPEIDSDLKNQIRHLDKKELLENLQALGENLTEIESLDQQRLARRLEVLKQTGKTLFGGKISLIKFFIRQKILCIWASICPEKHSIKTAITDLGWCLKTAPQKK